MCDSITLADKFRFSRAAFAAVVLFWFLVAVVVVPRADAASGLLLVFTKTTGFRHDSIPAGIDAVQKIAAREGWGIECTEDAAVFTSESLARFTTVVFLNTSGDPLDAEQMNALREFLRSGRGFVGVHAASDTALEDEWYPRMLGARFRGHPRPQHAVMRVHHGGPTPSIVAHLGATWEHFDEWYAFREPVVGDAAVLLEVDENSYEGKTKMNGPHPSTWTREFEGARVFYTALGHTAECYTEPEFVTLLTEGIRWANGP